MAVEGDDTLQAVLRLRGVQPAHEAGANGHAPKDGHDFDPPHPDEERIRPGEAQTAGIHDEIGDQRDDHEDRERDCEEEGSEQDSGDGEQSADQAGRHKSGVCYETGHMDSSANDLPLWEFATPGPLRERLNGLALAAAKTGTFSLRVLENALGEGANPVGKQYVMVGTNGARLAVLEITGRVVERIADVWWEQVDSEGESFTSVDDWRRGHERFWSRFTEIFRAHTNDPDWQITDDTEVVYETFRIVERLPGAAEARYPVVECSVPTDEFELASADLYDLGTVGIEELGDQATLTDPRFWAEPDGDVIRLRAGFPSDELAVAAESALAPRWQPRFEVLLGDDWLDAWREHFEPLRVGRLVIVPAWKDDAELMGDPVLTGMGFGDVVMHLDPGRSFGTGAHVSTRLALGALQELDLAGARVLDIGCGSGVIAIAALLLGAAGVHGLDIEEAAIERTLRNAEVNAVASRCSAATTPIGELGEHDIVVANILAPVLIGEATAIARTVRPGGVLILSGFVSEQADRVADAYAGLSIAATWTEGAWVALMLSSSTDRLKTYK